MEVVVCAAISHDGNVICGPRHLHCYEYAKERLEGHYLSGTNTIEGFVTSTNRFITREEAAKLVLETGQKLARPLNGETRLFSEHLY